MSGELLISRQAHRQQRVPAIFFFEKGQNTWRMSTIHGSKQLRKTAFNRTCSKRQEQFQCLSIFGPPGAVLVEPWDHCWRSWLLNIRVLSYWLRLTQRRIRGCQWSFEFKVFQTAFFLKRGIL